MGRVEERRRVLFRKNPLSSVFSPFVPHEEKIDSL
jgi:hypothetical protein